MRYIIFFFILVASLSWASDISTEKLLRDFDSSFYYPQNLNLRDFQVDVRVDGLLKQLNDQLSFGKLKDIFFKISWLRSDSLDKPNHRKVEVVGMPDGFFEVKSGLINNILYYLDFIIPFPQRKRVKDYKLSIKKSSRKEIIILAQDPKNLKDANEILLFFDYKKKLKKYIIKRAGGIETIELKLEKKPWGKGKWVIDESYIKRAYGNQIVNSLIGIKYKVISGYGLPESIQSVTQYMRTQPNGKKQDDYERSITSQVHFVNWMVNSGLKEVSFKN